MRRKNHTGTAHLLSNHSKGRKAKLHLLYSAAVVSVQQRQVVHGKRWRNVNSPSTFSRSQRACRCRPDDAVGHVPTWRLLASSLSLHRLRFPGPPCVVIVPCFLNLLVATSSSSLVLPSSPFFLVGHLYQHPTVTSRCEPVCIWFRNYSNPHCRGFDGFFFCSSLCHCRIFFHLYLLFLEDILFPGPRI